MRKEADGIVSLGTLAFKDNQPLMVEQRLQWLCVVDKRGELNVYPEWMVGMVQGDAIDVEIVGEGKFLVTVLGRAVGGEHDGWWMIKMTPEDFGKNLDVIYEVNLVDPKLICFDHDRFELKWTTVVDSVVVWKR